MHIYTFSEAEHNFSTLLDQAKEEGGVQICGRDGQLFMITSVAPKNSPLNIAGVSLNLTSEEIINLVREGRERF